MRRKLVWLLALILCITSVPVNSFADEITEEMPETTIEDTMEIPEEETVPEDEPLQMLEEEQEEPTAEEPAVPKCHVDFRCSGNYSYVLTVNTKFDGSGKRLTANEDGTYDLEKGIYSWYASSYGYFTLRKVFTITDADIAKGTKTITVSLDKKTGRGPEPITSLFIWSDEVMQKFYSTSGLYNFTKPDTPAFGYSKGAQEFTTEAERDAYIKQKVGNASHLYMFYLDDAKRQPVVFATKEDLSGASDIWEAAEILGKSDKVTVYYQAQIHGNEPGSGEAALYTIGMLAGNYGASLTNDANIYIVPYANPDASEQFRRTAEGRSNLNRDALRVRYSETTNTHRLFNLIMPEVAIDSHEFALDFKSIKDNKYTFEDIKMSGTCSLNIDSNVNKISQKLASTSYNSCVSSGFRAYHYGDTVNNTIARTYYGLYNCCSILIESVGITIGKAQLERRVYSEYTAVKSVFDYAASNSQTIVNTVANARSKVAENGKTYSSSRVFVLKHGHSKTNGVTLSRPEYYVDGTTANANATDTYYSYDKALRTRTIPTAYIIPKAATGASKAMRLLNENGISYFEVEPGAKIEVSSYGGTNTKAKTVSKKYRTFVSGAYVVPMNQAGAMVAAAMLEPDVTDTEGYNGSLVQSGILSKSKIYRFTKANPSEKMSSYIKKGKQTITADIKDGQYIPDSKSSIKIGGKCSYGNVTYKSSNSKVISVDSSGKATIKGRGTATITVTAPAAGNYASSSRTYKLTVGPDVSKMRVSVSTRLVKRKGAIIYVSANTQWLKDQGYKVKYRYYRYGSSGYYPIRTKSGKRYLNKKLYLHRTYYYKAAVLVYNKNGKLLTKTSLSQCPGTSRYYGWK